MCLKWIRYPIRPPFLSVHPFISGNQAPLERNADHDCSTARPRLLNRLQLFHERPPAVDRQMAGGLAEPNRVPVLQPDRPRDLRTVLFPPPPGVLRPLAGFMTGGGGLRLPHRLHHPPGPVGCGGWDPHTRHRLGHPPPHRGGRRYPGRGRCPRGRSRGRSRGRAGGDTRDGGGSGRGRVSRKSARLAQKLHL